MTDTGTQPIPSSDAPFGPDDPRLIFGKAVALAGAVIRAVTPEQLDRPTPCDDFTVRDLLGHLVGVLGRVEAIGRGEDPMAGPARIDPVADDAWSDAWATASRGMQAAFADDAVLDRIVVLPWREATAGEQLLGYANEISVHTWDVAQATDQQPAWDDDVLAQALTAIRSTLPAGNRAEMFAAVIANMPPGAGPMAPPFAEAITVADDAPMIDQLVSYNGRQPAA